MATDGDYTRIRSVLDRTNLQLDPGIRAPRTDEYSVGVDREVGRRLATAIAYVHKSGANFIGWTDIGGQYRTGTRALADGQSVTVCELQNSYADLGRVGRLDLLLDMLNMLNDAAGEGLVSDTLVTESVARNATFGQANVFPDPRRVMLGLRLNLGR